MVDCLLHKIIQFTPGLLANTPPPVKGLNIRIPIIIPAQGRGFIIQGSASVTIYTWAVNPAFIPVEWSYEG